MKLQKSIENGNGEWFKEKKNTTEEQRTAQSHQYVFNFKKTLKLDTMHTKVTAKVRKVYIHDIQM